jgi:predicted nucleic acid-binding protein
MIVISDSSPLNYLILIGHADLLQRLYGQVLIPPAVYHELQRPSTPPAVRDWMVQSPAWLKTYEAAIVPDTTLNRLDPGEREAIALAETLRADAILIDERDGRRVAEQRHLTVIGTLQILDTAAENGLIDLPTVLDQLQSTTFRVSTRLLKIFLNRDAGRKKRTTSPAAETSEPP